MITPEAPDTLDADHTVAPSAPSDIARMARSYQAGDVVFAAGDSGAEMFIVLKGGVRMDVTSDAANVHLGSFTTGEFFGEMALVGSSLRTGTATVQADGTELVAVNHARFVYLVSQQPAFALSVMRVLAQRIESMNQRLLHLTGQPSNGAAS